VKRADQVGESRQKLIEERQRQRRVQRELAAQRRKRGLSLTESIAEINRTLIRNVKDQK
jgi:hypothetical protein